MVTGRVAVTGGTGFVGGHLIAALKTKNCALSVLARHRAKAELLGDVEIIDGDIGDSDALARLCEGVDVVIHCAGLTMASSRADYQAVNVTATEELVRAARNAGVKTFILVSSLAAREPDLSDYAASKKGGEEALRQEAGDMKWLILRPPAVYGPGDKGTLPLMTQLTRKRAVIPGSAGARFSVIHVTDLAQAVIAMLENPLKSGEIYDVHDGQENGYSWQDLAAIGHSQGYGTQCHLLPRTIATIVGYLGLGWAKLAGGKTMVTPGKIRELYHKDWVARRNLLDQNTGWHAKLKFGDGFEQTVEWYRARGWL